MVDVIILDDERLARVELKRLLREQGVLNVEAEFSNVSGFIEYLDRHALPDILFLDIQMPGITGLQVAKELSGKTKIVFCTAYSDYAIEAFELNAVDYLLKPIRADRLAMALARCQSADSNASCDVDAYLPGDHCFLLRFGDVQRFIRLDTVERFEVVGNDTALYTPYGKGFLRVPLNRLARRLNVNAFFRANRSEIISIDRVRQIEPGLSAGAMVAIMCSGEEVKISRRQLNRLKGVFRL